MTHDEELVEKLAALAHESWAGWTVYMLANVDGVHPNGETYRDRWTRQINTPYTDLSEAEKESDRVEVRKVLDLLDAEGALHFDVNDIPYISPGPISTQELKVFYRQYRQGRVISKGARNELVIDEDS